MEEEAEEIQVVLRTVDPQRLCWLARGTLTSFWRGLK
jgi:hypothetical protein